MWIIRWINPFTIQMQCPMCGCITPPLNLGWYRRFRAGVMSGCSCCYNYFMGPWV